jgi:DHA1 family multidrug resistance protein-like MFS transporter
VSLDAPTTRAAGDRWVATLVAVCIAQATAIAGFDFTLPFVPLYLQHDLGVHGMAQTALWAGLIGFGPAIPATILGPVWGRVADRFGYRAMLLRAMACAALFITLMGLAPSAGILFALRLIQGGLTGTVYSAQALVAVVTPEQETGRAMGLLQMSVYVGATIGPIGGGAVAQLLGYRAAFVSAGILLGLATLIVFIFVREPRSRMLRQTKDEPRPSMLSVLTIPAIAAALFLTCVVQLAGTALFPVIPLFVQDLLGGSRDVAADTGWVMALSGVTGAIGSYLAGKTVRSVGMIPLIAVAIGLSSLLLAAQAIVPNYVDFMLLRAAFAFAFGALFSTVGVWAATTSPRNAKGTAFGLMGAASSLGFGAGPLLGGALTAALGIRPLFLISALALCGLPGLLAICTMFLPVPLRKHSLSPRVPQRLSVQRDR